MADTDANVASAPAHVPQRGSEEAAPALPSPPTGSPATAAGPEDASDASDAEMDGLSELNATTVSHTVNGESQVLSGDDRDSRFDLSSPPNATTPRHEQPSASAVADADALPPGGGETDRMSRRQPTSLGSSPAGTPDRPASSASTVADDADAATDAGSGAGAPQNHAAAVDAAPAAAAAASTTTAAAPAATNARGVEAERGGVDAEHQRATAAAPELPEEGSPPLTKASAKASTGAAGKTVPATVTPAALSAAHRVKVKRRDVRESRGGGSRSVHDRGLLGSQAGGHRGGQQVTGVPTTRLLLQSAAEDDDFAGATMSAVSATPATTTDLLPTLADGANGSELVVTHHVGVAANTTSTKTTRDVAPDPYPLAPSIRSPAPRVVKLADKQSEALRGRQRRREGQLGSKHQHQALTPQPTRTTAAEQHLNAVVATLRPVPAAESLVALTVEPPPQHALSPDPVRRWQGLDSDLAGAARRRQLEPSALRAPQALRPAAADAVVVQQQRQIQINLQPLSTPQATAAALLKLQEIEAKQETRRVQSLAPLSPADARRRKYQQDAAALPPGRSKSSIVLGGGGGAAPLVARRDPQPDRAKSTVRSSDRAVPVPANSKPLYVAPNRRVLAPIASMPRAPDGRPLFDAKARRRELQRHAARLVGATTATTTTAAAAAALPLSDGSPPPPMDGGVRKLVPLKSIASPGRDGHSATTPPPSLGHHAPMTEEVAPDPIAEVVASIPLALRRHMALPESSAMAAKRKDNEQRMRRCRRETAARLRERDLAVDDTVEEARQRDVFKVQRTYRLAALAAEQQEQPKQ